MKHGHRRGFDPIGVIMTAVLVATVVFLLAPVVFVIINAFNAAEYNRFPLEGVSLRWFEQVLFSTPQFHRGFRVSVIIALGATGLALVLATFAARGLVRYRFRIKGFMQAFLFSPQIVPRIIVGCSLFLLYIRVNLWGTIPGLILAHSILGLPFAVSVITATMIGIPPGVEEAAMDLGARPVKAFLQVTLPQMRSGLIVSGLFAFIISFDQVNVSMFLTRPAYNTLPIEMFIYVQNFQDPTLSALSALLIFFSMALVLLAVPFVRGAEARRLMERR